jgi:hypothetical protein
MSKSFSSYEVGDEVTIYDHMPGVVSFISIELQTMSICVGRGCPKSEDTNIVVGGFNISDVSKGWPDREVALAALTPRPCRWYDGDNTKRN